MCLHREAECITAHYENLDSPFRSDVGNIHSSPIGELYVCKDKIVEPVAEQFAPAACRACGIDLIAGVHQHMLQHEPHVSIVLYEQYAVQNARPPGRARP